MVVRSVGATPSDEWEHPRLHNLVDGLCATMGLPRPTICVVDSAVPNAMAVGRDPDSAKLVVTSGLDESLTLVELEGVLAHELVHIKRHDTVVAGLAVVVTVPWAVLRGNAAGADRVHTLVGRGREFSADQRAAAVVVRYPPGIGSALEVMVDRPGEPPPWPPGEGQSRRPHPLAVDRPDGRSRAGRVAGGQPRRHPGAGRGPVISLSRRS